MNYWVTTNCGLVIFYGNSILRLQVIIFSSLFMLYYVVHRLKSEWFARTFHFPPKHSCTVTTAALFVGRKVNLSRMSILSFLICTTRPSSTSLFLLPSFGFHMHLTMVRKRWVIVWWIGSEKLSITNIGIWQFNDRGERYNDHAGECWSMQ